MDSGAEYLLKRQRPNESATVSRRGMYRRVLRVLAHCPNRFRSTKEQRSARLFSSVSAILYAFKLSNISSEGLRGQKQYV